MGNAAKKILGSGSLYTIATIAPILTLLAVTPIVTAMLGPASYGEVAVAISVYQLSSVLLVLGLPSMVTRDALMRENGFRLATGYVVLGSAFCIALASIACLSTPLWAPAVFPGVDPFVVSGGIIAGAGLAIVTLGQAVLRAAERALTFVALAALSALLPPILGLVLISTVERSANLYALGLGCGYGIVAVISIVVSVRHARPSVDLRSTLGAIAVGLPTVPHSLSVPALLSVVVSMALRTSGVEVAGQIQVAVLLGTAGITILNAVNNAWSPMIFKAEPERRQIILGESTMLVAILSLVLIGGYAIVGPLLMPFIGQDVVTDDEPVRASMVIAGAGALHVLYLANIHLTFISKRTWPLAISTPTSAVIAIAIGWSLSGTYPSAAIMAYAMVWPVFYLLQSVFAWLLALVGPLAPAPVEFTWPILLLGLVIAGQAALVGWQPWSTVITTAGAMLAGAFVFAMARRSAQARASLA